MAKVTFLLNREMGVISRLKLITRNILIKKVKRPYKSIRRNVGGLTPSVTGLWRYLCKLWTFVLRHKAVIWKGTF